MWSGSGSPFRRRFLVCLTGIVPLLVLFAGSAPVDAVDCVSVVWPEVSSVAIAVPVPLVSLLCSFEASG